MMENTNIPDQTVCQTTTETKTEQPDKLYAAARIISAIFTPFMAPLVAFMMLFSVSYLRILPIGYKLTVLSMVASFTVVLPMLGIFMFHKVNGWGIHELGKREKRFLPYGLTIMSYVACLLTMYRVHLPRYMSGIITATLICMLLCTAINLKWKISTHMASCGIIIGGLLSHSLIFQFNPTGWLCLFTLLAGMLGSARIIVKQHTLNEVAAGFFVGLFCGIIGILFI